MTVYSERYTEAVSQMLSLTKAFRCCVYKRMSMHKCDFNKVFKCSPCSSDLLFDSEHINVNFDKFKSFW